MTVPAWAVQAVNAGGSGDMDACALLVRMQDQGLGAELEFLPAAGMHTAVSRGRGKKCEACATRQPHHGRNGA